MGFLDNYEASRERLERWLKTYPTGRIETRIVEFSAEKGYVLVEAKAFRNDTDLNPAGIDYAYGYQGAYQPNMRRWFVEDSTTSAIMRVQQLVMGGAERSTKETMEQVEKTSAKVANTDKDYDYWATKFGEVPSYKTEEDMEAAGVPTLASGVAEIATQLGGQLVAEAPQCRHGHRIFRSGNSAKTKKDWANYSCVGRKPDQCDPIWLVLTSDGTWKPQI
jgi:hypothetical protein